MRGDERERRCGRRELLAATGSAAAWSLAGCLGDSSEGTTTAPAGADAETTEATRRTEATTRTTERPGPTAQTTTTNERATTTSERATTTSERTTTPPAEPEFVDSFERETIAPHFEVERTDGNVGITDQYASAGERSLQIAAKGGRSITSVHSTATFEEANTFRTRVNPVTQNQGGTAATMGLMDADSRGLGAKLSISAAEYAGQTGVLTLTEFNEDTQVVTSQGYAGRFAEGEWGTLGCTVGQGEVTLFTDDHEVTQRTRLDWSARPIRIELRVRDSGDQSGMVAAFDDVEVRRS